MITEKLNKVSEAPRPFPGKYPTRISLTGFLGLAKKPFCYDGKPSPDIIGLLHSQYFRAGGIARNLMYKEYDQNGIIFSQPTSGASRAATFCNMYYAMPKWVPEMAGRGGILYMLLDRGAVQVKGRRLFIPRFTVGTPFEEPFIRLAEKCAQGKNPLLAMATAMRIDFMNILNNKAMNWVSQPIGVTKITGLEAATATRPTLDLEADRPRPFVVDRANHALDAFGTIPVHQDARTPQPMWVDETNALTGRWPQAPTVPAGFTTIAELDAMQQTERQHAITQEAELRQMDQFRRMQEAVMQRIAPLPTNFWGNPLGRI